MPTAGGAPVVPMPNAAGPTTAARPATRPTGRSGLDSLERAARALARTEGCRGADECRAAPLGAKACGGPRSFVVYCARTTDTVALFRALAALERAEKDYNARNGVASTCEMRLPPMPGIVGGRCAADGAPSGNAGPR